MDAITQLLTRMDTDMNGAEMVAVIREAACLQVDLMSVDELGAAIRRLRVQIQGLRDRAVPVTASESALINQLRAMMDEDLNAAEMITTVKACARLLTNLMSVDELGAEIRRLYPQLVQRRAAATVEALHVAPPDAVAESAPALHVIPELPPSPIAVAESIEVVVAERLLAQPDRRPAGTAERKPRPPYNHYTWPSPLPRLMVLALRWTDDKRIPHDRALALLAERFRCSVDEFLTKSRREVAEVLFPFQFNYGKGWRAPTGFYKLLYRH